MKILKPTKNKIFVSFIEEAVLNPRYKGYIGGRVEVYYPHDEYASEEIRFFTKKQKEFFEFREYWDFRHITKKQLDLLKKEIQEKYQDWNHE